MLRVAVTIRGMAVVEDGYHIDRELKAGTTFLATDAMGRRVVLKRLPDDCFVRGQLHPSIKQRLRKLRELPMGSFVNIIGVERLPHGAMLVSEYAEGVSLDQAAEGEQSRALGEVQLAVAEMHQLGMVHGALHAKNIIIGAAGRVCLIDPSPLLHDDPAVDIAALERMNIYSMKRVTQRMPAQVDAAMESSQPAEPDARHLRQRTLLAAVALVVLAIGAAVAAVLYLGRT